MLFWLKHFWKPKSELAVMWGSGLDFARGDRVTVSGESYFVWRIHWDHLTLVRA